MMIKTLATIMGLAFCLTTVLGPVAEARGHHGGGHHGHRHCRMHSHMDFGTNRCVRNHS